MKILDNATVWGIIFLYIWIYQKLKKNYCLLVYFGKFNTHYKRVVGNFVDILARSYAIFYQILCIIFWKIGAFLADVSFDGLFVACFPAKNPYNCFVFNDFFDVANVLNSWHVAKFTHNYALFVMVSGHNLVGGANRVANDRGVSDRLCDGRDWRMSKKHNILRSEHSYGTVCL